MTHISILWRHDERDGVSNHRHPDFWSTVCSGADQRKYHSSTSLAFVRGIHDDAMTLNKTCLKYSYNCRLYADGSWKFFKRTIFSRRQTNRPLFFIVEYGFQWGNRKVQTKDLFYFQGARWARLWLLQTLGTLSYQVFYVLISILYMSWTSLRVVWDKLKVLIWGTLNLIRQIKVWFS